MYILLYEYSIVESEYPAFDGVWYIMQTSYSSNICPFPFIIMYFSDAFVWLRWLKLERLLQLTRGWN